MKSKLTVSSLKAGDTIKKTDLQFMVDDVQEEADGMKLWLSDATGKIPAFLTDGLFTESVSLKGQVISLEGVVLYLNENTNRIKIRSIQVVKKEDIDISVFSGIAEEVLDRYEAELKKLMVHLKGSPYEELVHLAYNESRIACMRRMPATLIHHCCIKGGMLQAAVVITRLAVETGRYYIALSNKMYPCKIEWDLLIAAALLHNFGNFLYYSPEEPFSKTSIGINYGYQGCVTEELENVINTNNLVISPIHKAKLIGVIAQCNPYGKFGAKAMRAEAVILKSVFSTFVMADMFDCTRAKAIAENENAGEDEEYIYDTNLRCYVTLKEEG